MTVQTETVAKQTVARFTSFSEEMGRISSAGTGRLATSAPEEEANATPVIAAERLAEQRDATSRTKTVSRAANETGLAF